MSTDGQENATFEAKKCQFNFRTLIIFASKATVASNIETSEVNSDHEFELFGLENQYTHVNVAFK